MDFGGLDRLLCSEITYNNNSLFSGYDLDTYPKSYRFIHEKPPSVSASATAHNQEKWGDMKLPEISQDQRSDRSSVCSDSQNLLSFSSPNSHQDALFPHFDRNNNGMRGPFTSSQWMELEHQALIYNYMRVNAPVPSNLLIPVRKALETAEICSFPATNLRHTTYGWGGFHLGFSNNSDPEPGRCRRTDGKKWRCSRDAVTDQKYCERHMNRGRHRSRKPVEAQTGHSVSNGLTTNTTTASAAKLSSPAPAVTNVSTIISPFHHENQHQLNRGKKIQDSTFHSMLSSSRLKIQLNSETSQPANWIPVSWETSIGGPLGEVLNHSTNNIPSSLNLPLL